MNNETNDAVIELPRGMKMRIGEHLDERERKAYKAFRALCTEVKP